ncbi:MAG: hypothetical protein ACQESU_05450 [Halobacteriota archaeon]
MDTLTIIGIAILAFVLVVAFTSMNLKATSSFQKEASGSSVFSRDIVQVRDDAGENEHDVEEDENEDETKTDAESVN